MSWICAAGRSPATCQMCLAVALELSIFLANCWTLLAGNFCMLMLPSFILLVTKSLSFIKNQKISLCNILAVSGRYFAKLLVPALHYTTHHISATLMKTGK